MPRRRTNGLGVREKPRQAQGETQGLRGAEEKALPSSLPSPLPAVRRGKPGARSRSSRKWPRRAASATTQSAGVPCARSSKGATCKTKNKRSPSRAPRASARSQRDPLSEVTGMLVQFLMQMCKMKKPIRKADMLKIVQKKYKKCFLEILGRASFSMEVVFGVDLREVDAVKHIYDLVSKMDLPYNGRVGRGRGFPKTGLLMHILGVIFVKGNCATEQEIWEFLNKMRVYAGKRHFIFGEPRKLITQDFVKLKYLEYRQVPGSDPPGYEFLWGPRARAETTKMKVLQFWAKINHTDASAFPSCYEEALREEEERAQAAAPLGAGPDAQAVSEPGPCPAAPPAPGEAEAQSSFCD